MPTVTTDDIYSATYIPTWGYEVATITQNMRMFMDVDINTNNIIQDGGTATITFTDNVFTSWGVSEGIT